MKNKVSPRYLDGFIRRFLEKKMVFLGGPRQVGKTTACLQLLDPPSLANPAYMNWDDIKNKKALRNGELPNTDIVILDELHKFRPWRNLVKGFYDKKKDVQKFIVTGSARLD